MSNILLSFLLACFLHILHGKSTTTNILLSPVPPGPNDVLFQWPRYTFNVDFKDKLSNAGSNKLGNGGGVMALALYTDKSFFGGDCKNYLPFNCSNYNCFDSSETTTGQSHPYFEIDGHVLHTELYLDYMFFSNPSMNIIYAQKCSNNLDIIPERIHGTIGFGLEGSGINNFMGQYPTFSIYLDDKDDSKSQLIFDCDARRINQTGLHQSVTSTRNWEVPYDDIKFHDQSFAIKGTTIFDINLPYIGLPLLVYERILILLEKNFHVKCLAPSILHRKQCTFTGNYSDLPSINLEPGIKIPPQVYLKHIKDSTYKLNLVALALSPERTQPYIKVIEGFKKHVILGAPFMEYFYVCFEAKPKSCEINVYERDISTGYDPQLMFMLRVVGAIAIPFLLCCCFCCISIMKEKKKESAYEEIILKDEKGISRAFLSKEEVSMDFECVVEGEEGDFAKEGEKKARSDDGLLSTQVGSKVDPGLESLILQAEEEKEKSVVLM